MALMASRRQRAVVKALIDGETLDTSIGKGRLADAEARELHERGGQADRQKLASILKSGDEVALVAVARDRYRRRIARVYVGAGNRSTRS